MHDPVLAGWCMVVTTMQVHGCQNRETWLFPLQKHGCFTVVSYQVAACLEQPTNRAVL